MSSNQIENKTTNIINDQYEWYRLDNAATIFSLVNSDRITCLFRLSATLENPIEKELLQQALNNTIERFPYYKVELRRGLFWYYWESNPGKPIVIDDSRNPMQKMPITKRGIFPFRVRVFNSRIAVEFHHSITDGTGALIFLKTLIAEYFFLKGIEKVDWQDVFRLDDQPHPEEYEDGYKKNYQETIPSPSRLSKGFHLPYNLEPKGIYNLTTGIMDVKEILKVSRALNVTLTEYLIAVYLDALQDILFNLPYNLRKKNMKPIRIMVPVNLRKIFPSQTMRNFSLMVTPEIDPRLGRHSFSEILKHVYHYMRVEVSDKFINQQVARNVRGELHPLVRAVPLPIKKLFGKIIYNSFGRSGHSGGLTNLGRVTMPEELNHYIKDIQFIPGMSPITKSTCAIISFKDKLYINFGSQIKEKTLEKLFFSKLVKEGIKVKIETN
ncbi:MAG: hypothetical protein FK733_09880 [Asgard group archaeon]|nr:hypothetical protein [Asgard group archaeon]